MPKQTDSKEELVAMGKRIAITRKARGLTQRDLADAIGMDPQNISKIETGQQATSSTMVREMCAAMDVSADYILRGIGKAPRPASAEVKALYPALVEVIKDTGMDEAARAHLLELPDPGFDPGRAYWVAQYQLWLGLQEKRPKQKHR